ncbi:Hypothetical predicted protein, partial [Xyrichtys novacula]
RVRRSDMVADGKHRQKGRELEMMCVMLVDPSFHAGGWSTTGIIPPPLLINTEPHIQHLKVLSYSCGHVDADSADKIQEQHSSILSAIKRAREEEIHTVPISG